jgi:hypothetical protein
LANLIDPRPGKLTLIRQEGSASLGFRNSGRRAITVSKVSIRDAGGRAIEQDGLHLVLQPGQESLIELTVPLLRIMNVEVLSDLTALEIETVNTPAQKGSGSPGSSPAGVFGARTIRAILDLENQTLELTNHSRTEIRIDFVLFDFKQTKSSTKILVGKTIAPRHTIRVELHAALHPGDGVRFSTTPQLSNDALEFQSK